MTIPLSFPSFEIAGNFPRDAFILAADLDRLGFDIRSFKEPLTKSVKQVIIPSIRENFDSGGRPEWDQLAASTIATRLRQGYGIWPPLTKTGALKKKATVFANWTISRDSAIMKEPKIKYAKYHQSGTSKMPQRAFAMIQDEDEDDIETIFRIWLEERIAKYFARG